MWPVANCTGWHSTGGLNSEHCVYVFFLHNKKTEKEDFKASFISDIL